MTDRPFLDLYSINIFWAFIISSGNQSCTRVKSNGFASHNETVALLVSTSLSHVQDNILKVTLSQGNQEKNVLQLLQVLLFTLCGKGGNVLLQTLEKEKKIKSRANPVGGWSQGGLLLSRYGGVNGEAALNALMEPR